MEFVNRELFPGLTVAALGFAPGPKEKSGYVRRTEYRADGLEGIGTASWKGLRCEKSEMVAIMPALVSDTARRLFACTRICSAIDLVRTTVKSFVVLSVRDRSSGNSPATIAHSSRQITAATRIFSNFVRSRAIVKPAASYTPAEQ
jgi:hypothetical protein